MSGKRHFPPGAHFPVARRCVFPILVLSFTTGRRWPVHKSYGTMGRFLYLYATCLVWVCGSVWAQEPRTHEFGRMTVREFMESERLRETGAEAVVLYSLGDYAFLHDDWFMEGKEPFPVFSAGLETRIKILSPEGARYGMFEFPYEEKEYNIIAKYNYDGYPANPNGSPWSVAGVCSKDGRHLAMMPHPERAIFPWQCGYYPADRKENDEVTPWIEAFVNARKWIENNK